MKGKQSSGEQKAVSPRHKKTKKGTSQDGRFPIVGVGASAGGLEAVERLLRHLPENTGMAFVIVQHLDPNHESRLTEILSRATSMPVAEAQHGGRVEPNRVYIIPPNKGMTIRDRVLHLGSREDPAGKYLPVDSFFRSLAAELKNKAIGVILSGTASDGAMGVTAIKGQGGITFAQNSATAKYYGMPQSAIASGNVDFVLPPEDIARYLTKIGRHPYIKLPDVEEIEEPLVSPEKDGELGQLFHLLRKSFGVDFSGYKFSTINRRIRRRMALRSIDQLKRYLQFIRGKPEELKALYQDMFVGVTEFFREPGTFQALEKVVYPRLLKNRKSDAPIRIWVPGCSTGEEVYSIAMSLLDYLGNRANSYRIQIFGTDINEEAIKKARLGKYVRDIAPDVGRARLGRYFVKTDEGYQISKAVRELCVFAKHDAGSDPPFSRLDLLSCRNLLIYLGPALQRRLISLFHYTLNASGYLVLGTAETISDFSELFAPVDRKHKIYAKKSTVMRPRFEFAPGAVREPVLPEMPARGLPTRSEFEQQKEAADLLILNQYAPSAVLVNENFEILHFRGHTGPYLEPSPGVASLNLLKMAREGLLMSLRSSLEIARKKNVVARKESVRVEANGAPRFVNLHVAPVKVPGSKQRTLLVVFEDVTPPERAKAGAHARKQGPASDSSEQISSLKHELATTKAYLQSVIEGQEASNEELRSLNEEILSTNEELQSTTEELETANEELQSANEELTTLNEELQHRNQEISLANNDILNLLSSMNLSIVILDRDSRIRRLTPIAQKLLNLIPADIGRPLTDIRLGLDVPNLDQMIAEVMETIRLKQLEIQDREGRWYSLQVRPYITAESKIDGAVVVLLDIHDLRQRTAELGQRTVELGQSNDRMQEELLLRRQAEDKFRILFESAPEAILIADANGKIALVNAKTEQLFGYRREELIGNPVDVLVPERFREPHASYRAGYSAEPVARPMGKGRELAGRRKDGGEFPVEISLNPIQTREGLLISSSITDISERLRVAQQAQQGAVLEERNRLARDVHDTLAQGLIGILLQLDAAEDAIDKRPEELRERLASASRLARANLEDARRSVLALRPEDQEPANLIHSLEHFVQSVRTARREKIEFSVQGTPRRLTSEAEENLLRMAQEGLNNAIKHSGATKIRVELIFAPSEVRLRVVDNGKGFSLESPGNGGFGMTSLRERATQIGAQLEIKSSAGKGTRIEISV